MLNCIKYPIIYNESFIFYNYDKNRNLTEYGAKWGEKGEYEAISYKLNWNEKQVASTVNATVLKAKESRNI